MKPIPGFEGRYSAEPDGRIYSHLTKRHLRAAPCGSERQYMGVCLGRGRKRNVHTLILLAFVGPPPTDHVARHLNGNGHHNAVSNLRWSTQSDNCLDKRAHGTMVAGEKHHACVLSDVAVAELRRLRREGLSFPKLGERFGISTSQAHRIATMQSRAGA